MTVPRQNLDKCAAPGCDALTFSDRCPEHRMAPAVVDGAIVSPPARRRVVETFSDRSVVLPKPKAGAGNTKGGEKPRIDGDRYYTPEKLSRAICRELTDLVGIPKVMIEPSAGQGSFVRAARAEWGNVPHVIAIEKDRSPNFMKLDRAGADEVHYWRWEDAHDVIEPTSYDDTVVILGNPPFDVAGDALPETVTTGEEHLRIALERLGHGRERTPVKRYAALLFRQSILCGAARCKRQHMARGGLRHVINLVERPSFTPDGKTDGSEYIVGIWQAGYRGHYTGSWLSWADDPTLD